MSKLCTLLGAREPMFSRAISSLEKSTGHSAVDVRLIADITEKAHKIMRRLKLDVRDTTARELYYALNAAITNIENESLFFEADYIVLDIEGDLVSFNLIDIIENYHHQLRYEKRLVSHGQLALGGELFSRYVNHRRTNRDTVTEIFQFIGLST